MECEYCNKTFSTKSNLSTHQTTAKYCLAKQGKENANFKCKDCSRTFTVKKILTDHVQVCKERDRKEREVKENEYIKTIRKLESENNKLKRNKISQQQLEEKDRIIAEKIECIAKLEERLEKFENAVIDIKKAPTTSTHIDNRVQTILTGQFDMSNVSRVSDVLDEFLDKNVVVRGQQGLGEMIATRLLRDGEGKPLYVCTDPSRHRFEFINTDGLTELDPKALKLIRLIQQAGLCTKTSEVVQQLYEMCEEMENASPEVYSASVMELMMLAKDSSKFRSVLAAITAKGAISS